MNELYILFEERLAVLSPTIRRWAYRHYQDCGDIVGDLIQNAYIELWQRVEASPDEILAMPDPFWMNAAKIAARNEFRRLRRQVSRQPVAEDGSRPIVKVIFAENELTHTQDETSDDDSDAQLSRRACKHVLSRYTPELLQAEARIDLQQILRDGFKLLGQHYHADMRKFILDFALGYSVVDSQKRHGWTENRSRTLQRLFLDTFYEVATGEKRPRDGGSKQPATEHELQRIHKLHAQGLSYPQIARLIGRSPAFVQQQIKPTAVYDPAELQRVMALRAQGFSQRQIAAEIGRSKSHVQRLMKMVA